MEYEKIAIFDQYHASSRVVNLSTVRPSGRPIVIRVSSDRHKLVTFNAGSTEAFVDRGRQTTKHHASVNIVYNKKREASTLRRRQQNRI